MRPRKNKTNLPPCMYFKHGRHWYVKRGKWQKLSRDYGEAMSQYARLTKPGGGIAPLIRRTLDEKDNIKPNTRKQYELAAERIIEAFQNFEPDQVKPHHVRALMDAYRKTPVMANRLRTVLKMAYDNAMAWGMSEMNPATVVKPFPEKGRNRYITDDEYTAIRSKARPYLALMMDLAYLTGQRVMDVVLIKESDIRSGGIYFEQEKTGNRVEVGINEAITTVIEAARALHKVRGTHLFHTGRGKPYSYYTISDAFSRARKAAGVKDAQFRDIRAKSATDAEEAGLNATLLLGHSSAKTTQGYLRKRRTIKAVGPDSIRQCQKR